MTNYPAEAYMILAQEIFRRVYAEESPDAIHKWLLTQVQRLGGDTGNARLTWAESFEFYDRLIEKRIAEAARPASERRLITWPWQTWNALIDPLEAGLLAVLSAADGVGKTLYAECIAEHWARSGFNVVFVHFELNRALMLDRRASRHTAIERRALKLGTLTPEQLRTLDDANKRLRGWPGSITYVHTPGWDMNRVMGEVGALVRDGLCDVVVIDYLEKAAASQAQLRAFGTNSFSREGDNVEIVKQNAEMLEIPALLLAQLNKSGKRQEFADLDRTAIRGAGEKTERANVVVLLHKETSESNVVQVRVDKNTMGRCGSFTQIMNGARFMVYDEYKPEEQR